MKADIDWAGVLTNCLKRGTAISQLFAISGCLETYL